MGLGISPIPKKFTAFAKNGWNIKILKDKRFREFFRRIESKALSLQTILTKNDVALRVDHDPYPCR
jgi:hypothetical protein